MKGKFNYIIRINEEEENQITLQLPSKEQIVESLKNKTESIFTSKWWVEKGEEEEEIKKVVKETILEEPVLSEYAANNYWRKDLLDEIKDLELEYD